MEQILSFKSRLFFGRALPLQENKQKIMKVVPLCKIGRSNIEMYIPYTENELKEPRTYSDLK